MGLLILIRDVHSSSDLQHHERGPQSELNTQKLKDIHDVRPFPICLALSPLRCAYCLVSPLVPWKIFALFSRESS